jgi:hypothetical protein
MPFFIRLLFSENDWVRFDSKHLTNAIIINNDQKAMLLETIQVQSCHPEIFISK